MSVSVLHHQEWELLGPGAPASERPNAVAERQRAAAAAPPRVPVSEPLEAVPWCAEAARHPTAPMATDERWQHIHTPTLKWDDHGAQTAAKVFCSLLVWVSSVMSSKLMSPRLRSSRLGLAWSGSLNVVPSEDEELFS